MTPAVIVSSLWLSKNDWTKIGMEISILDLTFCQNYGNKVGISTNIFLIIQSDWIPRVQGKTLLKKTKGRHTQRNLSFFHSVEPQKGLK